MAYSHICTCILYICGCYVFYMCLVCLDTYHQCKKLINISVVIHQAFRQAKTYLT